MFNIISEDLFIKVCNEVFEALDQLDPGPNKWRETMITEIKKAKLTKNMKQQFKLNASGST